MWGSLYEMEVAQACASAVEAYKRKLNARKSLSKGGSILACNALKKIKDRRGKKPTRACGRLRQLLHALRIKQKTSLMLKGSRHERMRKHASSIFNKTKLLALIFLPTSGSLFEILKRILLPLRKRPSAQISLCTMPLR
jgi:hypothetical protein